MARSLSAGRPTCLMVHDYPPLTGGGLALAALELARCLRPAFECRVVSSRLCDHFADDRPALSARAPPGDVPWTVATSRDAVRWLRDADVLIVHWTFSFRRLATAALVVGPLLGRRTACVIHTAPDHCDHNRIGALPRPARRFLEVVLRLALRRCTEVVALSATHAAALERVGVRPGRVLPMPVAPAALETAREAHGNSWLGFAGELSTLKGADELPPLVRALAPRYGFRIAGDGPLAARLAAEVGALARERRRRVELVGRLAPSAMPAFYAGVDYVLVLSRTEAQCRVVLEAMLAGAIVLARPSGGIVDLVRDGTTGFLIDPANPAAVRALLTRLDRDRRAADTVRTQARAFAMAAFARSCAGWGSFVDELFAEEQRIRKP